MALPQSQHRPQSPTCLSDLLTQMEQFFDQYSRYGMLGEKYHQYLHLELKKWRKCCRPKCLDELCDHFDWLMMQEPNLIQLPYANLTYYFFGDLHGSLSDLCLIRDHFWKRQSLIGKHFIFLGDYVDRGIHGFEVFFYLLMIKLTHPAHFTILRGNHEFSEMNIVSFLPELQIKFGQKVGHRMWTRLNETFSMLPYAALVANTIFCCHGGIPKNLKSLQQIEQIPKQQTTAMDEESISFQLVWNDFYTDNTIHANIDYQKKPRTFVHNLARGCGYVIGSKASDSFFRRFNLHYIVRAHDYSACEDMGYDFLETKHGTIVTLFSNSSYTGAINNTSCLIVNFPEDSVQICPLVTIDQTQDFFNKSELIEMNGKLIEMKFKDPFQTVDDEQQQFSDSSIEQSDLINSNSIIKSHLTQDQPLANSLTLSHNIIATPTNNKQTHLQTNPTTTRQQKKTRKRSSRITRLRN